MPILIFCAGCAAAVADASATATRTSLEAIDPLLRIDPFLETVGLDALGLCLLPRVVGFLRLAEHVVDDAEVDIRLGRIAAELFELVDLVLAECECGAIHREMALLICSRGLVRGRERL